jgi:hypothetical protein
MPRKQKTNLSDVDSKTSILNEIYKDTFTVKNTSLNILKSINKNIDYENKEEVLNILPLVQKQMDIINHNNDVMLQIQAKLNGE